MTERDDEGDWPFLADEVAARLEGVTFQRLVAFAAAVCERLLPNYLAFHRESGWGDPAILRAALDEAWDWAAGTESDLLRLEALIEACEHQAPDAEAFAGRFVSPAIDATVALCETLAFCADGDEEHVATVGSLAGDTIDVFVEDAGLRRALAAVELRKQEADLEALQAAEQVDAAFLARFRATAVEEGRSNIGAPAE